MSQSQREADSLHARVVEQEAEITNAQRHVETLSRERIVANEHAAAEKARAALAERERDEARTALASALAREQAAAGQEPCAWLVERAPESVDFAIVGKEKPISPNRPMRPLYAFPLAQGEPLATWRLKRTGDCSEITLTLAQDGESARIVSLWPSSGAAWTRCDALLGPRDSLVLEVRAQQP